MSIKNALILSVLIPVGLAVSLPAYAMGPRDGAERPSFTELDANGDGQLTLAELEAHGEARFAATDTDGDGLLSRDELIAAGAARVARGVDARLERFDDNEDGMLSANEADDMRPRRPSPERIFGHMDADGDGVVTEAEFEEAAARFMERRDERRGHGRDNG